MQKSSLFDLRESFKGITEIKILTFKRNLLDLLIILWLDETILIGIFDDMLQVLKKLLYFQRKSFKLF
jgi:hypothetical protein